MYPVRDLLALKSVPQLQPLPSFPHPYHNGEADAEAGDTSTPVLFSVTDYGVSYSILLIPCALPFSSLPLARSRERPPMIGEQHCRNPFSVAALSVTRSGIALQPNGLRLPGPRYESHDPASCLIMILVPSISLVDEQVTLEIWKSQDLTISDLL
jgi:hypothetical protein